MEQGVQGITFWTLKAEVDQVLLLPWILLDLLQEQVTPIFELILKGQCITTLQSRL